MLSFKLINRISQEICDMRKTPLRDEFSPTATRQLDAISLIEELLEGRAKTSEWHKRYSLFCNKSTCRGVAFAEESNDENLLLEDLLEACDENVLDALLIKYGETSTLGTRMKECSERIHVRDAVLQKQIEKDISTSSPGFYKLLREAILKKYDHLSEYYNEIVFSRKLFSKIKKESYTLSRENALWLITGLAPDYWQFTRLFNAAGYSLREGNRRDTIIKFVIKNGNYTLETLNEMLEFFEENCIGI